MRALTAAEMREADRLTTERLGISPGQLMENAASQLSLVLMRWLADSRRSPRVILCGKGNNGGDGLALARLLRGMNYPCEVLVFSPAENLSQAAAQQLRSFQERGGEVTHVTRAAEWEARKTSVLSARLLVDALLGTGLNAPVEGFLAGVIEDVNRRGDSVLVAVDIPSGLPSDGPLAGGPAIRADCTVTFTAPKIGLLVEPNTAFAGQVKVCQIGTPQELIPEKPAAKLFWSEPQEFRRLPLSRRRAQHKGDFGHVLIVAGSRGKSGAAALAGLGALRSGAGLVTVATPESMLPVVAGHQPELMTEPLAETDAGSVSLRALEYGRFEELLHGKSVLALGPGLGTHPETVQFIRTAVRESPVPVILDADGLNAFAGCAEQLNRRGGQPLAVTPHPGEMARLRGTSAAEVQKRRLETASESATAWNAFTVLKGASTLVAAPDGRVWVNSTGNPGMATAGTGDVLTGILAGLTAQLGTRDWERVLALGVYLHGAAGDAASRESWQAGLIASDVAGAVPVVYTELRRELGVEPY